MVLIYLLLLAWIAYAILRELEARKEIPLRSSECCPGCADSVDPDWIACPHCRSLLHDRCSACGNAFGTYHPYCPWCGESSSGRLE